MELKPRFQKKTVPQSRATSSKLLDSAAYNTAHGGEQPDGLLQPSEEWSDQGVTRQRCIRSGGALHLAQW